MRMIRAQNLAMQGLPEEKDDGSNTPHETNPGAFLKAMGASAPDGAAPPR